MVASTLEQQRHKELAQQVLQLLLVVGHIEDAEVDLFHERKLALLGR